MVVVYRLLVVVCLLVGAVAALLYIDQTMGFGFVSSIKESRAQAAVTAERQKKIEALMQRIGIAGPQCKAKYGSVGAVRLGDDDQLLCCRDSNFPARLCDVVE
jgi:hypothetical protein